MQTTSQIQEQKLKDIRSYKPNINIILLLIRTMQDCDQKRIRFSIC